MFYLVHHFANSFINGFFFPRCFSKFIILEIYFFRWGCSVYHWYFFFHTFFSVGLSLSNTELIFFGNMSSAGAIHELAFTLSVMRYMDNIFCNSSFAVSILLVFLIALLNTSTNLLPFRLTLGGRVEMLSVQLNGFYKNFQNLS